MNYGCSLFLIETAIKLIAIFNCIGNVSAPAGQYLQLYTYGQRVIVLVVFKYDERYALLPYFIENLKQFAFAFNCPGRNQYITFYFGGISTRIDCDYGSDLNECIENRFVCNRTTAKKAFESSVLRKPNDTNTLAAIDSIISQLAHEWGENDEYANNTFLPLTYSMMKKFIFLTNSIYDYLPCGNLGNILALLAINSRDLLYSKASYRYSVSGSIFLAKVAFTEQGIDRDYSQMRNPASVLRSMGYCIALQNGPSQIGGALAPTQLTILMAIEIPSIASDHRTIITNFFRQLFDRIGSEHCTIGFDAVTGKQQLIDHIVFYIHFLLSTDGELYHFRMPWSDRQTMIVVAQSFVDEWIDAMLTEDAAAPTNLTYQRPHFPLCEDESTQFITENIADSPITHRRLLVVSNPPLVVYDCFASMLVDSDRTLSDYLESRRNVTFDYVYFNNNEFNATFTSHDLHQSLFPAFWQSNRSGSHLYFVNSINNLNKDANIVAFCADNLSSTLLVKAQKCIKLAENKPDSSAIVTFSIVTSLAFVLTIAIASGLLALFRKYIEAKRIRSEFMRQIQINERHEFDYIQTLWRVSERSVEIDYGNIIGKGMQSIVYRGKLKQKSPIVYIFNQANLAHFDNCSIAIKQAKSFAIDYFYEQTLNEIRVCSKIGYHRNICAMLGYVSNDRVTYLLLELAVTNLDNALKTIKEEVKRQVKEIDDFRQYLLNISIQIADAMLFISGKKLIHRDLAARNVLLSLENRAMISDFGLCVECKEGEYVQKLSGPLPIKWLAIESINENRFSEKSDVWSFGVLLYEMYSLGDEPYGSIPIKQLKSFLNSGKRMDKPKVADDNIYGIMQQCWKAKPDERPPFNRMRKLLTE